MKKIICLLLCLVLLGAGGSALAADLPDTIDPAEFADQVTGFLDGLDIPDALRELDFEALRDEFRALARESGSLDDDALDARIRAIASEFGLTLTDEQVASLRKTVRLYEKEQDAKERVEDAKSRWETFRERLAGFGSATRRIWRSLGRAFSRIFRRN